MPDELNPNEHSAEVSNGKKKKTCHTSIWPQEGRQDSEKAQFGASHNHINLKHVVFFLL